MTRASRRLALGLAAVALLAIAVGVTAQLTGLLRGAEERAVAARYQVRGNAPPPDVAVVAIDDQSFRDMPRGARTWPFKRRYHAQIIDALRRAGARAIVYDVQFTEPTTNKDDLALYDAVARAKNVVLATTESDAHGHTQVLGGDENLKAAHAGAGAANLPDRFGAVLDRVPYAVGTLKSLAVVTAERVLGRAPARSVFGDTGAWIDYRGGPGAIPTYSFTDVLYGKVDPARLRGRVVIVGATTPTLQDVHATPTAADPMAGPEIQANAVWTVLHGVPLRNAGLWLGLLLVAGFGLVVPLLRLRVKVLPAALVAPVLGAGYAVAVQVAFEHGRMLWAVAPLVTLAVSTIGMVVASHLAETTVRRRVARMNALLEERVRERTQELRSTQLEILLRLGRAAEWRDKETGEHIHRIGVLTEALALELGMPVAEAELLRHASTAHDLGKIGIPDSILLKPGGLTDEEREGMQRHTLMGASLLAGSSSPLLQRAEEIARTHHERWDGTGYPYGLAGEEIPLAGRLCALCDVFDALVSARHYKAGWTTADALAELRDGAGTHFDPAFVEPFVRVALRMHDELYGPEEASPVAEAA